MAKLLLLHGPNLNLLGTREPEIYGGETLQTVNNRLIEQAQSAGHQLDAQQSNAEHELIKSIHDAAKDGVNFIIINPGAFTHTSVALRDAIAWCSYSIHRSASFKCALLGKNLGIIRIFQTSHWV